MRTASFALVVLAITNCGIGCGGDTTPPPVKPPPSNPYGATIRWTSFGIPHIVANDLGSLGFGFAYASARDSVCPLADQVVKVTSRRAKYFGAGLGGANLTSDFAYLSLGLVDTANAAWDTLDPDVKQLVEGYAAGYNHYLQVSGQDKLPAPCTGAEWVVPVTPKDLLAYYLDIAIRNSSGALVPVIGEAMPPNAKVFPGSNLVVPNIKDIELGSNGWAIGRDRAENGRGMLVANPHFNWEGELRFYEAHLTIPDQMDVYGAALLGSPVINIGFNAKVGWTHTVTPSVHFTAYKLELDPMSPTTYKYEGAPRMMESREYTIEEKNSDGTISPAKRTLYRSHYGPMLGGNGVPWDTAVAFSVRDANVDDVRIIEQWLRMAKATNVAEIRQIHADVQGVPWAYTLAADDQGNTLFMDGSRVPHLSDQALKAYIDALTANDPYVTAFSDGGILLLDGSTSRDEWVNTDTSGPLVPPGLQPLLERPDFVMNANGPPWLANPAAPLTSYPLHYGPVEYPISPRTRMNFILLTESGADGASGADQLFSMGEVQAAILSNRGIMEERLRAGVVSRCQATPTVDVSGMPVDISGACSALAAWNGRLDTDSVGALVWREFLGRFTQPNLVDKGSLYAEGFDPLNPLGTPRTLVDAPASGPDPILVALAKAESNLNNAGFTVDTSLGAAQFVRMGESTIPIHGGLSIEGTPNIVSFARSGNTTLLPKSKQATIVNGSTSLTKEGYLINSGTSFLLALEYTSDGPHASAVMSYSQSTDPSSPHFADQTQLFSKKSWRPVLFREPDIKADPEFVEQRVEGGAQ